MKTSSKLSFAAAAMAGLLAGSASRAMASTTAPAPMAGQSASVAHGVLGSASAQLGLNAGRLADAPPPPQHDCKGKNACKGQGGCKTGDNGCKTKNSCSGKGGCSTKKSSL